MTPCNGVAWSSLLWFVAVLALIPLALWLLKRTPLGGGAAGTARCAASARCRCRPNQRIVTVEVGQGDDRRWLVLGVTPQSITHAAHDGAAGRCAGRAGAPMPAPRRRSRSCWRACGREARGERCAHARAARVARIALPLLVGAAAAALAQQAAAGPDLPLLVGQGAGGTSYSVPIQTLLFFTALSFLPAVLLLMTGFTRIVIVLSLLRQALGTQAAPPNQVIVGLSLFLTFFVMGADARQGLRRGLPAVRRRTRSPSTRRSSAARCRCASFMLKQTRQSRRAAVRQAGQARPGRCKGEDVPFKVLVPAFVTSELKSAFQIGFLIFIPFLIIDMIVASVLMCLGMMMLSPVLVALPFKLMLFVLADGWNLLLGSLAAMLRHLRRRTAMDAQQVFTLGQQGLYLLLMVVGAGAAGGAGRRPGRQHLPGRHADQRGHAVLRAEDRRRRGGAGDRRAVDADHAGRVPAAHAAVDPRRVVG